MMDWTSLLSTRRLGQAYDEQIEAWRSPYEVDLDRIAFTQSFRHLQGKMQVQGPGRTDDVRTRLTHSIEVSRVGRSLGALAGRHVAPHVDRKLAITPADIGHIVCSAACAHDIGSMPFGHEGERIVSTFFAKHDLGISLIADLPPPIAEEFRTLEGNAYGFRFLSRLEGWKPEGGLQLTAATLGAFMKYPWSITDKTAKGKYGFLLSERDDFAAIAGSLGLVPQGPDRWCRHPLAYLVEAADDISYLVVDIEDAVNSGIVSFLDATELLSPIARLDRGIWNDIPDQRRKLIHLRSRAIGQLVSAASDAFGDAIPTMLQGKPVGDLLAATDMHGRLAEIRDFSRANIYRNEDRRRVNALAGAGIETVLGTWATWLLDREHGTNPGKEPPPGLATDQLPTKRAGWLRAMIDQLAAMTDPAVLVLADTL